MRPADDACCHGNLHPAGPGYAMSRRASALFKHEPFRRLREGARTTQSLDLDIWS
jgi:hypothetical protein